MSKPLLSILIPTVWGREDCLWDLIVKLTKENFDDWCKDRNSLQSRVYSVELKSIPVEVVFYKDNKEMAIGEKREKLYKLAKGLYSWQIDDDDDIAENAIELILEAIKNNPEIPCITFREKCMMNGVYKSSNHSIRYEKWQDNFDGYDYVRCPFYKDVIRTDIAQSVPFPHIRYNEDEQWSMAIKPLLTDEIHIDEELYHYIYEPKETHEERYGFDKHN